MDSNCELCDEHERNDRRRADMPKMLRMLIPVTALFLTGHRALGQIQAGDIKPGQASRQRLIDYTGEEECRPASLETTDYFLDVISTLPNYQGQPARIQIHRVRPVYNRGDCRQRVQPAILVHGRSIDSLSGFDLQYSNYSLIQAMANAGIDAFAVNLLGFGQSTRFGLDDPCNASTAKDTPTPGQPVNQQATLLIPNPLPTECAHSDSSYFMDRQAQIDELSNVVRRVQDLYRQGHDRHRPARVSLLSWSLGGFVLGAYLAAPGNQVNVKNVVFIAPPLGFPDTEPTVKPTYPLLVGDFSRLGVLFQISPDCPGQQDPNILQPIWDSVRQQDPLGATWSNTDPSRGGVVRYPTRVLWGWNAALASTVTVPTMTIVGDLDTIVGTMPADRHHALGSSEKVLLHMECASHAVPWEGSTHPSGWGGPHATAQDAVVQWMKTGTYHGVSVGIFHSLGNGSVVQEQ
jgi:pimeloyl-ACP methyl ester carboxylesterase